MSSELEIQQLVEAATKSVHALRIPRICYCRTEKHGTLLADTQEKQAKIEQDIAVMLGVIDEIKKAH